jgi:hypothetical protein
MKPIHDNSMKKEKYLITQTTSEKYSTQPSLGHEQTRELIREGVDDGRHD